MAGMSAQDRYFFDLYGYLVIEDVLSSAEVDHLNRVWDGQELLPAGSTIASQRLDDRFLSWDPACLALLDHDRVLPVLVELCGPHVRLDHAYGILMQPGTSGLGLHGGGSPFDPSQYYLVRNGAMRNGLCVVSFALVDTPEGAGGFCCIPGSHKAAFPLPDPAPPADHPLVHHIPHRAGSVVVFTEALTHGTLPWVAPQERRNLLFKYSPGNSSWNPARPFDPALLDCMTPRQRRLVEPPYVGGRAAVEPSGPS